MTTYIVFLALLLVIIVAHLLIVRHWKKQLRNREKALADTRVIYETNRRTLTDEISKHKNDYSSLFLRNSLLTRNNTELNSELKKLKEHQETLERAINIICNIMEIATENNIKLISEIKTLKQKNAEISQKNKNVLTLNDRLREKSKKLEAENIRLIKNVNTLYTDMKKGANILKEFNETFLSLPLN